MLPTLLKKIQSSLNVSNLETTNITTTNNINLEEISNFMSHSPNPFIKIMYNIFEGNPYVIFLFVVTFVFFLTLILRLVISVFTKKKSHTKKNIIRRVVKLFLSSKFIWTGLLLGIAVGVEVLNIPKSFSNIIKSSVFSILLWIFYRIFNNILSIYTRTVLIYHSHGTKIKFFKNKNAFIVISRAIHVTWFLVFITILLGLWGVELGPILAGLGIVGIVVGLALQDSLSHVVGGISLMLDETYSEGDYVILDSGQEGIIFQIGYRSTKLRTFDEEVVIIPNGLLSKMTITNLSQPVKRIRINTFYKTFSADASPQKVKKLLIEAAKKSSHVLKYPEPYVFFLEPSGNLLSFRLSLYTHSPFNRMSCKDEVQNNIVELFNEHNIKFGVDESIMHVNQQK